MTNAIACELLNPGSDLDLLPSPDVPNKMIVHSYASLSSELLHLKGRTGTSCLRQNDAQIPHQRQRQRTDLVW